jgi:hypothetical protein
MSDKGIFITNELLRSRKKRWSIKKDDQPTSNLYTIVRTFLDKE